MENLISSKMTRVSAGDLKKVSRDFSVVVVDDVESARDQLGKLLGNFFQRIFVFSNGLEAWEFLNQKQEFEIDIVLSDIRMPAMDGLQLAEAIRGSGLARKIILISAHNEFEYLASAIRLNVDGFILKPVSIENLFDTLWRICAGLVDHKKRLEYHQYLERENDLSAKIIRKIVNQSVLDDRSVKWLLRSSEGIGGDIIACFRNAYGGIYCMVADATGHGLSAAIGLIPIYKIFEAMSKKGFMLSRIIEEMQKTLVELSTPDRFVATTLIYWDMPNQAIEIWNGGNPPVLACSKYSGVVLRTFDSSHLPLGISSREFHTGTVRWSVSEPCSLLVFSDGLIDASNANGARFGMEGVLGSVGDGRRDDRPVNDSELSDAELGADPFSRLVNEFDRFLGEATAEDDVSLIQISSD